MGNFLTAFTSRYSDYDGYWLFGLLVREGSKFEFDLLSPASGQSSLARFASHIAARAFRAQVEKSVVPIPCFSRAILQIENTGRSRVGLVNHRPTLGFEVSFAVIVLSDLGKQYSKQIVVFVAPHDPAIEHRSTRRISPTWSLGAGLSV
jgi:hypothetical protein